MNKQEKHPFAFPVHDHDFRKSSWSKNNPKTCVLVAVKSEGVAIRDSKHPTNATLFYTHDEWAAFVRAIRDGEFNA